MRFATARLPKRIWVVGPCGAGKTTVAERLATAQGLAATHLDEIHWRPGWVEVDRAEEERAVDAVVARPAWVIDGNYSRLRRPHRERVQLFVWLDLPLAITLPRLVLRGVVRSIARVPCCNGNYESLWRTFLHRDSLLLYALQHDGARRRQLGRELRGRPHVRLRHPRAIATWVEAAAPRRTTGPGAVTAGA